MKKRTLLILAAVLLVGGKAAAQDYKWALGVRGAGQMSGITGKVFLSGQNALEGMLTIPYKNGFLVTGLYERNVPLIAQGFNFYYGAGGHIGSRKSEFAIGIDGIVGLEYCFFQVPLSLGVDYKPMFNIASDTKFLMWDFGLSLRITF